MLPVTSQQPNKNILAEHTPKKMEQDEKTGKRLFKMLLKPMFEASHVKIWDRAIKTVKSVLTQLRHNKSETPDIGDQVSGKSLHLRAV